MFILRKEPLLTDALQLLTFIQKRHEIRGSSLKNMATLIDTDIILRYLLADNQDLHE